MSDKSFTLLEPHLHGNIQVGPKTISRGEAETAETESPVEAAEGSSLPVPALLFALMATLAVVAIAKRVRGGDDEHDEFEE